MILGICEPEKFLTTNFLQAMMIEIKVGAVTESLKFYLILLSTVSDRISNKF